MGTRRDAEAGRGVQVLGVNSVIDGGLERKNCVAYSTSSLAETRDRALSFF